MVNVHGRGIRIDGEDRALHRPDVLARPEVGGQSDNRAHGSAPSAQASQALFDSCEFLLSTSELAIGLRRAGLSILQLGLSCLEGRLCGLQRDPLGPNSIALPREFRE